MFKALLITGLAAIFSTSALASTTYTVSMAGDAGGADGGREFKTAAGGILQLKVAGDELVIHRGQYVGSLEVRDLKGAPNKPIIIRGVREDVPEAEAGQANAWMRYSPIIKADKDHAIKLIGCSYVIIDNLVFTGGKSHGIMLENCSNITIRNCDVLDNVRSQIHSIGGSHLTIDNCELSGSALEHGVAVLTTDNPTVRNCSIHHNAAAGIVLDGDRKSGGDGLIEQPVVENNILYANGRPRPGSPRPRDDRGRPLPVTALRFGNAAICGDGIERGIIRNNLIFRNFVGGIVLYREHAARAGRSNRLLHNTIYLPAESGSAFGIYLALMSQDTSMHSNIIITAQGPAVWIGEGATRDLQSDYNVVFRLDNKDPFKRSKEDLTLKRWQEAYRLDRNSIAFNVPFEDPDNVDLTACDFRVKPESSLGGRSLFNVEAQTDCLGLYRPRDKVTPGCYELRPADASQQPRPPAGHGRHGGGPAPAPGPDDGQSKPPSGGTGILPPI